MNIGPPYKPEQHEETPLIRKHSSNNHVKDLEQHQLGLPNATWNQMGCYEREVYYPPHFLCTWTWKDLKCAFIFAMVMAGMMILFHWQSAPTRGGAHHQQQAAVLPIFQVATGPYKLVERQVGKSFFDHYKFYNGSDSLGSGGHQIYVSRDRASELDLFYVSPDDNSIIMKSAPGSATPNKTSSSPANDGNNKRESIRLEGKQRYNHGLFVLDLDHMPTGAGVWPAFWMTDEAHWPDHGEIDIVEPINHQTQAKVALHTGGQCRMYGQVPSNEYTGTWDRASK